MAGRNKNCAVHLQVIGTGSDGTDPSLMLTIQRHGVYSSDIQIKKRYLFNACEGTQRLFGENQIKIHSLGHLFLTRLIPENIAGLAGLILSLSSAGTPLLDICGPIGLDTFCHGLESFVRREYPVLQTYQHDASENGVYRIQDEHLDIVPLVYSCTATASEGSVHFPPIVVDSSDPTPPSSSTIADTTGRNWLTDFFHHYDKAKLSQVDGILHRFPNLSALQERLAQKYDLTLEQVRHPPTSTRVAEAKTTLEGDAKAKKKKKIGEIVRQAKVPSPPPREFRRQQPSSVVMSYIIRVRYDPFPILWIIDCPSTEWIDATISMFSCTSTTQRPETLVHLTPVSVLHEERYWHWIHQFKETNHMIFDGQALTSIDEEEDQESTFYGIQFAAGMRQVLSLQSSRPNDFVLSDIVRTLPTIQTAGLALRDANGNLSIRVATPRLEYCLVAAAKSRPGYLNTPPTSVFATTTGRSCRDVRTESRKNLTTALFLGTGCAAPSKLRSSSGIYLALNHREDGSPSDGMLLDAGEGCFGQLWRSFGSMTGRVLEHLHCIWISHKHADHHAGLLKLLQERHRVNPREPVLVIAPQAVLHYVKGVQLPFQIQLVSNRAYRHFEQQNLTRFVEHLQSVPVHHCYEAYGLVLSLRKNKKRIVYSGDTRPCQGLIQAGLDADVLIHEATFDASMADDARRKKHSTVPEAIQVGVDMRAKRLILTHFSQRYPSVPPPDTDGAASAATVEILMAFDGLSIRL